MKESFKSLFDSKFVTYSFICPYSTGTFVHGCTAGVLPRGGTDLSRFSCWRGGDFSFYTIVGVCF